MTILDRYILRAFLTNYLIALLVLMGLYIVLDLFVNLDEFAKSPADTTIQLFVKIITFYGYNLFWYFAQLSGVVILAAACFTLGRFHRTNEFTAVLASGTSLYRVAAPLLVAALVMNGLWFVDQEVVIPRIADKLARKHDDIEGRRTFAVWFLPDRDQGLLSAVMFSPRTEEIRNLIVMERDADLRMTSVVRADRARWDPERRLWVLENGSRMRLTAGGSPQDAAELGRTDLREYGSDLTPKDLALQQASQWTSFASLSELSRLQSKFAQTTEFMRAKHSRLTTVLVNLIMLLLGVPFLLNRERPQVLIAGAKALLFCGACFVTTFVCQNVELTGLALNPALPAWIPVLVFGPVAVVLLDGIKT